MVGVGLLLVLFMFLFVLEPLPVHAASTLVQQNNNGCGCTSLSVPFLSSVVSGNVVVVGVNAAAGVTVSTLSDSLLSSFTQAVTSLGSTGNTAYIFYATLSSGGADTVTATFSGDVSNNIYVYEVSGVTTAGAATAMGTDTSASFSTSFMVSFPTGAFLFGMLGTNNAGNTATAGTGFTLSPDNSGSGLAFAEYSTSGVSSSTNFPASLNNIADWAEAGIALNPAPSVSLSANPSSLTVTAGSSGTTTITVNLGGFPFIGSPMVSCSGLPVGATCSANPNPLPSPMSSGQQFTLTVSVPSSAAPGTYQVTVQFSFLVPDIIKPSFLAISLIQFGSSGGIGPSAISVPQAAPTLLSSVSITVIVQPATFPAVHQTPVGGVMLPSVGFSVLLPWVILLSLLGVLSVEAFTIKRHSKRR